MANRSVKLYAKRRGENAFTERTVLEAILKRDGERSVDSLKFKMPPNSELEIGDEVRYAIGGAPQTTETTRSVTDTHSVIFDGDYDLRDAPTNFDLNVGGTDRPSVYWYEDRYEKLRLALINHTNPAVRPVVNNGSINVPVRLYSTYYSRAEPVGSSVANIVAPSDYEGMIFGNDPFDFEIEVSPNYVGNVFAIGPVASSTSRRHIYDFAVVIDSITGPVRSQQGSSYSVREPRRLYPYNYLIPRYRDTITIALSVYVFNQRMNMNLDVWKELPASSIEFTLPAFGDVGTTSHAMTRPLSHALKFAIRIYRKVQNGSIFVDAKCTFADIGKQTFQVSLTRVRRDDHSVHIPWVITSASAIINYGTDPITVRHSEISEASLMNFHTLSRSYIYNVHTKFGVPVVIGTIPANPEPKMSNYAITGRNIDIARVVVPHNAQVLAVKVRRTGSITETHSETFTENDSHDERYKFGGIIRKTDDETAIREFEALSYGNAIADTEIRGVVFTNAAIEDIVRDLIRFHTDLIFYPRKTFLPDEKVERYVADGKLYDIIDELSKRIDFTFAITTFKVFWYFPREYIESRTVLEHGRNCIVGKINEDDSQLVNDLIVVGKDELVPFTNTYTQESEDATEYTIPANFEQVEVRKDGDINRSYVLRENSVEYSGGSGEISITYWQNRSQYARSTREQSISKYGIHAKKILLSWTNRADVEQFLHSYLNLFDEPKQAFSIRMQGFHPELRENTVVHVKDSVRGIDGAFVIKSIEWKYPTCEIELSVGEYNHDEYDMHSDIVAKLHNIENDIRPIKHNDLFSNVESDIGIRVAFTIRKIGEAVHAEYGHGLYNAAQYGDGI